MNRGEAVVERLAYKGAMPRLESGRYGVPREVILPTAEITLFGSQFSCPAQPEEHLRILYGNFREVEYSYVDAEAAVGRRQVDDVTASHNPGVEQG
jgi:hypothetical protein